MTYYNSTDSCDKTKEDGKRCGKDVNIDEYWNVEEIVPYIIEYLRKQFPDSIMIRELDLVDITVLGPNIPVEIQKTYFGVHKGTNYTKIAEFEDRIRRQIEQNVEAFGKCWFFFDNRFLLHLQNYLRKNTSINMDWFYKLYKEGSLKPFSITIDGVVSELTDKDLDFIRKFSNTCIIGREEEHRILQRNKPKIAYNVLKGHGFTTNEINNWYNEYKNSNETPDFKSWLLKRGGRQELLGKIRNSLNQITTINEILKCNMKDDHRIQYMTYLRIIEGNGNDKRARIRCSDNDNIIGYFPGYLEKKELWDYWRIHTVDHNTFLNVIKGKYPSYLKDRRVQKDIEGSWGL